MVKIQTEKLSLLWHCWCSGLQCHFITSVLRIRFPCVHWCICAKLLPSVLITTLVDPLTQNLPVTSNLWIGVRCQTIVANGVSIGMLSVQ